VIDPAAVSIVIPTLGARGGLLARAAESTLGHPLVIVDDGTPDDSVSLVAGAFGATLIRRDTNGGVAAAQNCGLDAVKTPWVRFLHSDDILVGCGDLNEPTSEVVALQSAMAYLPNGRVPTAEELLLHRVGTHISHYLIRTEVVRQVRFDERLRSWEDWDFIYRLTATGFTIAAVDSPFVEVGRDATDRLSASPAMLDGIVYLYEKHHEALRRHREARSAWEFKVARAQARAGQRLSALSWLSRSAITEPWHPRRWFSVLRLIVRP